MRKKLQFLIKNSLRNEDQVIVDILAAVLFIHIDRNQLGNMKPNISLPKRSIRTM